MLHAKHWLLSPDESKMVMLVKCHVAPSTLHGIGCFASEPVLAGTLVWEITPDWDIIVAPEDRERLEEPLRGFVEHYGYRDSGTRALQSYKRRLADLGRPPLTCETPYVLCCDLAKFWNHSDSPNVDDRGVAIRDIAVGEELTYDYRACDVRKLIDE